MSKEKQVAKGATASSSGQRPQAAAARSPWNVEAFNYLSQLATIEIKQQTGEFFSANRTYDVSWLIANVLNEF